MDNLDIVLELDKIRELLDRLGNPQDKLKYIHVAGTNGKGSVCAMTAQILMAGGYKTGMFTSPVIFDFREQFLINGNPISQEEMEELFALVKNECAKMKEAPSEFEQTVAVAFLFFAKEECDIVVLEVGMGGEGDATNIISSSLISVIVNIDFDHMQFLGNSIAEIAQKKAGIIKKNGIVVMASQSKEAENVIEETAGKLNCKLIKNDEKPRLIAREDGMQYVSYKGYENIPISLAGDIQVENASIVLEIISELNVLGYNISLENIKDGLSHVKWPGRFEIIRTNPTVIVDGAHNPHGIRGLVNNLRSYYPDRKFIFITGILKDKDYSKMLKEILPLAEEFITITPDNPRALSAKECAEILKETGFTRAIKAANTIKEAVDLSLEHAGSEKIICEFGSLYDVRAVEEAFMEV
ncbi:MAG: folylpolyglutamate synthase/dihydrofolate synthase family protein [Agathobacter sp.]|nr:folylpolyglutamate synthase/dihydrofolate synthase family protein [Agathobacter sp.]